MRKLMSLAGLLPAVASKRRPFTRVALAAALAVTLLWMGGDEARADSFNPTLTWSVANPVADAPSDFTIDWEIGEGDVIWGHVAQTSAVAFASTAWQITPSSDVDIGVALSTLDMTETWGFVNGPCNTPIALHSEFLNATTDKSQTVTFEDGFDDSNGDGNPDFIDMYPDFNDRILGPAEPIVREVGIADLSGTKVLLQLLVYEPGTTITGRTLDPALGRPALILTGNMGDPEVAPMPSGVTDICTPLSATAVEFGTAEEGTVLWKNPKQAGTYTTYSLFTGQRDADGDGHDNTLDTCPLDPDPTWDPRSVDADDDPDGDGIPNTCDPTPGENTGASDHDGDGYHNRGDNCPLVANGVADADNQGDSDLDGIGDACDPNPEDADSEGEAPEVLLSQDVTITEAAAPAVETPTPTVAPPATPLATPTPVVTPAPTPAPVIAPPPTGAGSASGTSWPWWPLAVAGAAAGAAGVLLAYQGRRAKP